MVKIVKSGKSIKVDKGIVLYVRRDKLVEADLINQSQVITPNQADYICIIFISEDEMEDKRWLQQ
jgi:hypothetical protein